MSRLFDGVDDQMVYAIPSSGGPNFTFGTILMVVKIANPTDTAWLSLVEGETAGGSVVWGMGRNNNGGIYYVNQSTIEFAGTVPIQDGDGWMLVALTKATGSVAPTAHRIVLSSGTRTSTALPTSFANSNSSASGNLRLGGNDDFANIYLAAAAVFVGTVLTTTQLDAIAAAKSTQSILDLSPTWLVDDSDAFATDLTVGTVNRTSITGTTSSADNPSGWAYLAAGPTPVSTSRVVAYDLENTVSAARAIAYNLKNTVAAARAVAYDIENAVAAQRVVSYGITGIASAQRVVAYDLKNAVQASRAIAYDLKNAVTAARAVAYDLKNAVQASRVVGYDVEAEVTAARQVRYDIASAVLASRSVMYDIQGTGGAVDRARTRSGAGQ